MPLLFLFLFLGLFLACFREGVWKMYSPEELSALRARDEEARAMYMASRATASPVAAATHHPEVAPAAHPQRRPQPTTTAARSRRVVEQMEAA